AEVADTAVDNYDFAMGAVVDAGQHLPAERVIPFHDSPGSVQFLEVTVPGCEAPYAIKHDVYLNSCPGAFTERFDKATSNPSLLKDVGFDIDAVAGLADCSQFCVVVDLPVSQDFNAYSLV